MRLNVGKVVALDSKFIPPQTVIDSLQERVGDIQDIYVVCVTKNNKLTSWASGNLTNMSRASLYMQRIATDCMIDMDEIEGIDVDE